MVFNSFQFLWLFPLIFVLYYGLSFVKDAKMQHGLTNGFLLVVSYLLYIQFNAAYALFLLGITLATYAFARLIDGDRGRKRLWVAACGVSIALLPLLIFKYYSFIMFQVGTVLSAFNIGAEMAGLNFAVPIGISFYTFQAIGYLGDVYSHKIEAEKNLWDYLLFISFFPQILAGPISTYSDLMPQIKKHRAFNYAEAVQGCRWLQWGMFLKVVMADRIGLYVDSVVANYHLHSGLTCMLTSVLYSIQIYGDFAGYSLMAIGVAKIMGFSLINNFNRPYFAATITEFWKRWHISLTKWLTNHIYIPLGGSRCSKPRSYANIMATFLVSGLWHGANWTFILWGALHGGAQVIEKATNTQKCENKWIRPLRIVATFAIVTLAWVFFRMPTIRDAFNYLYRMFAHPGGPGSVFVNMSLMLSAVSIAIVFASEWMREYRPKAVQALKSFAVVRWGYYLAVLTLIMLLGVLDSSSFIYGSF